MLYRSTIIEAASGSVGGLTFSRNRGGPYVRQRGNPINPATPEQELIRVYMGLLMQRWVGVLTEVQREDWNTYAFNVPLPNPLGQSRNVGGVGMYIRGNVTRLQAGLDIVDDAPQVFDVGGFTVVDVAIASGTPGTIDVDFNDADDWATETGSGLAVYVSRPVNQSVNYFKGPYRFAGVIEGDTTTPPTSPAQFTLPFDYDSDQRGFWRVRPTFADGRLGLDFRGTAIAS